MTALPGGADPPALDPRRFDERARALLDELARGRITVMGLGRFGGAIGLIRFLSALGADITVTDKAPAGALAQSVEAVAGLPGVALRLGGHAEEAFEGCRVLFVNPAVPPADPFVARARARGARIATEIGLTLALCPCDVIGITGSSGKSTTSALCAAMLAASGVRALLGGNVGASLLERPADLAAAEAVVLELSSFQLHRLEAGGLPHRPPRIAALVNVHCDHLNWHGTFGEYARCKRLIFAPREDEAWAVAAGDDGLALPWARRSGRRVFAVGSAPAGADASLSGAGEVVLRRDGGAEPLFARRDLALPGAINLANASFAAAAALLAGATRAGILQAARTFRGLPHRFEHAGTVGGVAFINSSVATTPREAARTLDAVAGPAILLAGGSPEKNLPFDVLARAARRATRCAVFFGTAAPELRVTFKREAPAVRTILAEDMARAFADAAAEARPGDTVILAPGAPSFDAFVNFQARGDAFKDAVRRLEAAAVPP